MTRRRGKGGTFGKPTTTPRRSHHQPSLSGGGRGINTPPIKNHPGTIMMFDHIHRMSDHSGIDSHDDHPHDHPHDDNVNDDELLKLEFDDDDDHINNNNNNNTDTDEEPSLAGLSQNSHHGPNGERTTHPPRPEEEEEIARDETRCVLYLRFLTFAFLAVTTIVVAVTVHRLMRKAEINKLAASFDDNAGKVLEAVGTILENTLMAVDSFAVSLTSYAETVQQLTNNTTNQSSWPFVTLPHFAVRASKLRSLSKIFLFTIYHYVTHPDRVKWELYTKQNKGWIDEGIETQKADRTFRGILNEDWNSSDQINFYGQRAADADFYIVRWQCSPVLVSV
jgi:hypothetical protein